jgi:putative FmdB family regulatory protein
MAIYEYQCIDCETKTTVSRSISEPDPGYVCKTCGNRLARVYTMSNPVFKGNGFYRTDK